MEIRGSYGRAGDVSMDRTFVHVGRRAARITGVPFVTSPSFTSPGPA
jgi:hypothetical protein